MKMSICNVVQLKTKKKNDRFCDAHDNDDDGSVMMMVDMRRRRKRRRRRRKKKSGEKKVVKVGKEEKTMK